MRIEILNRPDPWVTVLDENVDSATVSLSGHQGAEQIKVTIRDRPGIDVTKLSDRVSRFLAGGRVDADH